MRLILLILVIVLLIGALPSWPYSTGWGYYPAGGLGTILVILIILALLGVLWKSPIAGGIEHPAGDRFVRTGHDPPARVK